LCGPFVRSGAWAWCHWSGSGPSPCGERRRECPPTRRRSFPRGTSSLPLRRERREALPNSRPQRQLLRELPPGFGAYAAAVNEMSLGGTRPALTGDFLALRLIPSNARQEGKPAICLSQRFSTEETNQRLRQSRAKVPSSNQWIITQPMARLLILAALRGLLFRCKP
jgi:hypothetical protein